MLTISQGSFLYLPAALECSALVTGVVYLWIEGPRWQRVLLAATTLAAVMLAASFLALPWYRDRELRAFWSDFRRDGGQVGVGGSVVVALDGSRCWDYIGVQDGLAMAAVQSGLVAIGCRPECWTVSEAYNAPQQEQIRRMAALGVPLPRWSEQMPRLPAETHRSLEWNTVLVGGPTVNQISLEVLGRVHELADARNAQEGMDSLVTGYVFIMADKPAGEGHGPMGYHAFGWERHEVARRFAHCADLSSHGVAKVASPGRLALLFETEHMTLDGKGEDVRRTIGRADYGLVVRLRYRGKGASDRDVRPWRTLLLIMGWGGRGTQAAARATVDPGLVRLMNTAEAGLLDKLLPEEACCTELLVRTDGNGNPEVATERDAIQFSGAPRVKLENPSARCVPWG